MGRRRGGDKLHNKKKELEKKDFQRKTNDKATVPDVIIACEDSVSSPTYFQKIIDKLIEDKRITQDSFIIVSHSGKTHPTGVLEDLKNYSDENNKKYTDFEHKWIVIDRDMERVNGGGHTAEDFNNAIKNAKSKRKDLNIEVAYSNDSFELWYLLHFDYRSTAILRDEIIKKVIEKLKKVEPHKFSKLNKDNIKEKNYTQMIFDTLLDKQEIAINNAKNLLSFHGSSHNPEQDNPATKVHILVETLNNLGMSNKSSQ
ncbi:RloB family protein [Halarcobacter anaerophilus]|uniref:RloB domain-containing protein n=1 Tax=Halarcobacter anaerophilus TaxID=877500 RepID=A0A4V1LQ39_9BACT|nr:RloB family protein [Halarcobacter anaerophilus]QDF28637.1 RloB family protein [Halarcobacter anaerophilus]RXJ63358.1 hypothetical protein CRV06_06695 [Halarcobacter anaerophilus]